MKKKLLLTAGVFFLFSLFGSMFTACDNESGDDVAFIGGRAGPVECGSLSVGTGSSEGSASRFIDVNSLENVTVRVFGTGITTEIKKTATVTSGSGSVTIDKIPVGNNRIVSVEAYKDAETNLVRGAVLYGVVDIKAGRNSISIDAETSKKGIVYKALLDAGVDLTATPADVDDAIPNVNAALIDASSIAKDKKAGTLKEKDSYVLETSTVNFDLSAVSVKQKARSLSRATALPAGLTIFVKASSAPQIWAWENGGNDCMKMGGYDWDKNHPTMTAAGNYMNNGSGWWMFTIPSANLTGKTIHFKLNKGNTEYTGLDKTFWWDGNSALASDPTSSGGDGGGGGAVTPPSSGGTYRVHLKNCTWSVKKIYYYNKSNPTAEGADNEVAKWDSMPSMTVSGSDVYYDMTENWVTPGKTMIIFYGGNDNDRYPKDLDPGPVLPTTSNDVIFDLSTHSWSDNASGGTGGGDSGGGDKPDPTPPEPTPGKESYLDAGTKVYIDDPLSEVFTAKGTEDIVSIGTVAPGTWKVYKVETDGKVLFMGTLPEITGSGDVLEQETHNIVLTDSGTSESEKPDTPDEKDPEDPKKPDPGDDDDGGDGTGDKTGDKGDSGDGSGGKEPDMPAASNEVYSTNKDGKKGVVATPLIDTSATGWTEAMEIATSAAGDFAARFKGNHENCLTDCVALYGAYDDANLYIGVQLVNIGKPYFQNPDLDGGVPGDVPLIIALNTGKHNAMTGEEAGGYIWGAKVTFDKQIDAVLYMSMKPGLGEPSIFFGDATGKTNYKDKTLCVSFKTSGIEYNVARKCLKSDVKIAPNDIKTITTGPYESASKLNQEWQSLFVVKVPYSAIGVDKNYVTSHGIGVLAVATRGESGLDCVPYDYDAMTDNIMEDYGPDPSTSGEKNDLDLIKVPLAKIGGQ